MYTINVSDGMPNYSQRNNEIKPLDRCNTTSMVMMLSYKGILFPSGKYAQPEDNLSKFCEDNGLDPEVHDQLSKATNLWLKKTTVKFSTSVSIELLIQGLMRGNGAVISGTFPGYPNKMPKPYNHIVCLVGAKWAGNKPEGNPENFIIDDPFGNTLANWQGSGNDVNISFERFINWIKPVGNPNVKWAHTFVE